MAPHPHRVPLHAEPGPDRVPDRDPADGQAQTDLGPVDGLRRLRRGHGLRRAVCDGAEDGAEIVLSADDETGGVKGHVYGTVGGEVGRGGGVAEGG